MIVERGTLYKLIVDVKSVWYNSEALRVRK